MYHYSFTLGLSAGANYLINSQDFTFFNHRQLILILINWVPFHLSKQVNAHEN